jgi:DNA-binding MarR family transcriptional regulator
MGHGDPVCRGLGWYGRIKMDGHVPQPRISYVIARLERAVRRELARRVAPLTVSQYTALSILRQRDGLSNAQLARRTYVTPQSMSEVLAALERHGLVSRTRDTAHRRILRATLTRDGERTLAACDRSIDEMEELMLDSLSGGERQDLLATLTESARRLQQDLPH